MITPTVRSRAHRMSNLFMCWCPSDLNKITPSKIETNLEDLISTYIK